MTVCKNTMFSLTMRSQLGKIKFSTGVTRRFLNHASNLKNQLVFSEEVRRAQAENLPIVALESTIITHGMPYPKNVETAVEVEKIIRGRSAVPATIGVIGGAIRVGLTGDEIRFLGDPNTPSVKTSRRDFPYVVSQRLHGGTTVSGTMMVAAAASIPIFATGGVGGVHRGASATWDVSADLTELGRTSVSVISAGIKSILDIGITLEFLETQGVPVVAFGPEKDFPAFFTAKSGFKCAYHVENAEQAAAMIATLSDLGLQNGLLIGVPIPSSHEGDGEAIEAAIQAAVSEAKQKNIIGREVTPFILQRVNDLTKGKSLDANVALIKNNASVAADVARALAAELRKRREDESGGRKSEAPITNFKASSPGPKEESVGRPVVIGGSIADIVARFDDVDIKQNGGTYKGKISQAFGGVGRNLADALTRLGLKPRFFSAVGDDLNSDAFAAYCSHMDLSHVTRVKDGATPTYCAILKGDGDVIYGVGDMELHAKVTPGALEDARDVISGAPLVVVDGNVSLETLGHVLKTCHESFVPVWFEPTDIHKANNPFRSLKANSSSGSGTGAPPLPTFVSPNINELKSMSEFLLSLTLQGPRDLERSRDRTATSRDRTATHDDTQQQSSEKPDVESLTASLSRWLPPVLARVPCVLATLGQEGFVVAFGKDSPGCIPDDWRQLLRQRGGLQDKFVAVHFPIHLVKHLLQCGVHPATPSGIASVSGAGDCLAAAFMEGMLKSEDFFATGLKSLLAAQISLKSTHAVPRDLSEDLDKFRGLIFSTSLEKTLTASDIDFFRVDLN